jgi:hypothetical protein
MLFTEEQSDIILNNPKNLVNRFEKNNHSRIEVIKHGGSNGGKVLTTEERVLIGTVARAGLGTGQELADEFGVTRTTVQNLKAGRVSSPAGPRYQPHPELEEQITGKLSIVETKALDVLMNALGVITPDKLAKTNAKDASTIAVNASKIVQNCAPQSVSDNRIQVIMYAPKLKDLKEYDVVDV